MCVVGGRAFPTAACRTGPAVAINHSCHCMLCSKPPLIPLMLSLSVPPAEPWPRLVDFFPFGSSEFIILCRFLYFSFLSYTYKVICMKKIEHLLICCRFFCRVFYLIQIMYLIHGLQV